MLLSRVRHDVEQVVRVVVAGAALPAVRAGGAVAREARVGQGIVVEGVLVEREPGAALLIGEVLVVAGPERPLR